jgi:hypothetical protein
MELVVSIIKYTFVIALGIEAVIITRAIIQLAREKSRISDTSSAPAGK